MDSYLKDLVHLWSLQLKRSVDIEKDVEFPNAVSRAIFIKTLENCGGILSMVEYLIETNEISENNLKLIESYFRNKQ